MRKPERTGCRCPLCLNFTRVVRTREIRRAIVRRRECLFCYVRFNSYERIDMEMFHDRSAADPEANAMSEALAIRKQAEAAGMAASQAAETAAKAKRYAESITQRIIHGVTADTKQPTT